MAPAPHGGPIVDLQDTDEMIFLLKAVSVSHGRARRLDAASVSVSVLLAVCGLVATVVDRLAVPVTVMGALWAIGYGAGLARWTDGELVRAATLQEMFDVRLFRLPWNVTAAKEESAASALLLARLPDERPGAIQQRLHAAQHSANLYDELQQQQPDRFRANHACALVWHARLLDQTGQRQQAIDRSAKALLEYRDVVQRQTGHHTGLAGAATVYATLATDTDPLPFLQEAADAYHQAITEGEDAARPERARTHMFIADKLAQRKNQGRDTLTYSRAAVDEFIELAADNIITYGQEAVEHLLRHAQHLEKHGYTEASAFRHQARQINEQLRAVRTDADADDAP